MKLVNITNKSRTIYLFIRDEKGNLVIRKDTNFYPYYFEPDQNGEYRSYDNVPLRKIVVPTPQDVTKSRSIASYSSDILFVKRYLIDKVDKIDKTKIKYFFVDIEVLADEFPDYKDPKYVISCISLYNSQYDYIESWFLLDYKGTMEEQEKQLLKDFADYIYNEKPDIIAGWNIDFDYRYLYNRFNLIFSKENRNFAKYISPIKQLRSSKDDNIFYPSGISVIDYLQFFRKIFTRESSYALDYIAQKYLGEEEWGETEFGKLNEHIKEKNINDVKRLVKLEQKFNLFDYYDNVRRLSFCLWEDLYNNSTIIEMLLFKKAKELNIILPNKQKRPKQTFEGATREAPYLGLHKNVTVYDLSSAYPSVLIDFCLDSQNIEKEGIEINGIKFKQNPNALLPSVVREILTLKNNLKDEISKLDINSDEYKEKKILYQAVKGIVNSCFGVTAYNNFRLFDIRVASSITFLVRDLLFYIKDEIEKFGYKLIYWDTDGVMVNTKENIVNLLNNLVKKWAKEKYNKDDCLISFEYKGLFEKIFIKSKCRYRGYLRTDKGLEIETVGLEIKRSSSSKYEASFQEILLDKILNGEDVNNIREFVEQEKARIKTLPIEDIAFPCKIQNREYKNVPIFIRAYNNSRLINPKFNVNKGELFYYIFVKGYGYDNNGKEINVLAFTKKDKDFIDRDKIDWREVIRRNINSKVEDIFETMGWKYNIDLFNWGGK